jgi:hypothetical protein
MKSVELTDANRTLTNPDFIALIERARARFKQTGGISLEEMKRRWGGRQSPPKPARRLVARRTQSTTAARASRRSSSSR